MGRLRRAAADKADRALRRIVSDDDTDIGLGRAAIGTALVRIVDLDDPRDRDNETEHEAE